MPKPVFPDRPIWPPLPAETDRPPEGIPDASEPAPADAGGPAPTGHPVGAERRPMPAASATALA
jgi:hypothetical protein